MNGQLRAIASDDGAWLRERFTHVLSNDILAGDFVREWSNVQSAGLERLEQLRAQALTRPIAQAENACWQRKRVTHRAFRPRSSLPRRG